MAENWSTLTDAEVLEEFTPQEQATLKSIQGSANNLNGVVERVTAQVREAFRAGGRPVGDEKTVPDSARARAVAMARWHWLISMPAMKALQTANRKAAAEDAEDWLLKVENREIRGSGSAEIASVGTRRATGKTLDGL